MRLHTFFFNHVKTVKTQLLKIKPSIKQNLNLNHIHIWILLSQVNILYFTMGKKNTYINK